MVTWTIQPTPVDGAGIEEAIWEYATEVSRRVWGRQATEVELRKAIADDPHSGLAPPHGVFLVARDHGGAVLGYAGVRLVAGLPAAAEAGLSATAEVKRLYVRPAGRGMGLGKELLRAAEVAARGLGAARVVLETNTQLTEARAMYEALGYQETAPYNNHGAAQHWYAKTL
ncbi:GNAT family N-acetyltransferase [Streptomyces zagrosensis]|uniref:GNAT superfamily N-acetyltransferase n=1 Tax=Streptomyces zagrosensis TaxID=1042984 RepID=A0A7W9V0J8_9ACTN|nr:GNAT family N-acetyltransferase [Streptomyces zagrosensis]MBB5938268.1 GNAT superfamily N-acetyltransferase [Streptomyces zagrosensis]